MAGNKYQTVLAVVMEDGVSGVAKKITASVNGVTQSVGKFSSVLAGIGMGVGLGIFNAFAAILTKLTSIIPNLVDQGMAFGQTIDDIMDRTGATAEQASRLAGSFEYLGIPVSSLISLLPRLASRAQSSADEFKALGIDLFKSNGEMMNSVEILDAVRSKLGAVAATPVGQTVVQRLFGGQNASVVMEYLRMTDQQAAALNARMDQLGVTMGQAAVAEMELAQRARNELDLAFQGLANTIATTVAPVITQAVSAIAAFITQNAQAIANFVSQVGGFILGMLQSILAAIGATTSFTASFATLGSTADDTSNSLYNIVKGMAAQEKQAPKTAKAVGGGAASQGESIRKLDAQQERYFQRELARIDGILQKQLDALDKAENRQDEARQRADLQAALATARSRVTAGFDPTANDQLKQAEQDLADFEANVGRQRERERITNVQKAIDQITNIESTSVTTAGALRSLSARQERAERRRTVAEAAGDYAEARRQELIIDAIVATRRRILQKQQNEAVQAGLAAQTGAVRAATQAQAGFWTNLLKRMEREKGTERKKDEAGNRKTDIVIIDGKKKIRQSIAGKKDSVLSAFEEARAAGVKFMEDIKKAVDDAMPTLRAVAGVFILVATWIAAAADALKKLIDLLPKIPDWMADPNWWNAIPPDLVTNMMSLGGGLAPGEAYGGPVRAGQSYVVGERGPELLVMGNASGRVIPNNQLGGGDMRPVSIPIVVDGREIARVADRHLYWMQSTAPASRRTW